MKRFPPLALAGILMMLAAASVSSAPPKASGWLNWRGPQQNGTSPEKNLPNTWQVGGANHLWDVEISGRGTPVIANGRVYGIGYEGEGAELREVIFCLEADTGKAIWKRYFRDFPSDIIYDRYAIGSPTVDAETGNVYVMTTPGQFLAFNRDGKLLWKHSMMERYGRLTFPNGRTGSPVIDDDLVIIRGITSNWGAHGPARDRFYAFDKHNGELVWASTPGVRPRDSSFSTPVFDWRNGKRVFYAGTGCGNVVCVNVRTGEPLWRYQMSIGGVNSSVVLHQDHLIAIHGRENLDNTAVGRMVSLKLGAEPKSGEKGPLVLDKGAEVWRNKLGIFTSSPVIVGDRIYQVTHTGVLHSINADTGAALWQIKLGPDQLHASPLYADGKLYIPMRNGTFYILRPTDKGSEELCKIQLEGIALGAPSIWNGKIYVHTTKRLYCFGKTGGTALPAPTAPKRPKPGKTVRLQIVPSEVLLRPGEKASFTIRGLDANGFVTKQFDSKKAQWRKYIPPTAKVRVKLNADFNAKGELVAGDEPIPSAGAFEATIGEFKGYIRGRVLPGLPFKEGLERFQLTVSHATEEGVKFAYPPLPWIGARFKWEIRELDGGKVLAKTLDNPLFQRAITYFGHADASNYTFEVEVMTDGNRRIMSTVGVMNQRYVIVLLGNSQQLEVSSNHERLKVNVPFTWRPKVWYKLKTRVDSVGNGRVIVRAKAWERGKPEPEKWTIEVPHENGHRNGAPGLFGFAPQSRFRVYVDNISITPN